MEKMLQFTETAADEKNALVALRELKLEDGYFTGRLLPPSDGHPEWLVQTFFALDGLDFGVWLPDGCRVVLVPDSVIQACRAYEATLPSMEIKND